MIRIYIILVLVALLTGYLFLRWLRAQSPEKKNRALKTISMGAVLSVLVLLTITGRLNLLFAFVGVALTFLFRALPMIVNYAPQMLSLWRRYRNSTGDQQQTSRPQSADKMSREQALEILGLKPGASREEIIDAHRRLIARLHPDKGGSDFLAAQINLAKKTLLPK